MSKKPNNLSLEDHARCADSLAIIEHHINRIHNLCYFKFLKQHPVYKLRWKFDSVFREWKLSLEDCCSEVIKCESCQVRNAYTQLPQRYEKLTKKNQHV